jgi:hypothetical protein
MLEKLGYEFSVWYKALEKTQFRKVELLVTSRNSQEARWGQQVPGVCSSHGRQPVSCRTPETRMDRKINSLSLSFSPCPLMPTAGPLLTPVLPPPAEGPDHFGTPKPLESSSHVLIVPLQRPDLHDSAGTRAQACGAAPGLHRCVQTVGTLAYPPFSS